MTNSNNKPRELNTNELDVVSGDTFTIDMGWCAAAIVFNDGFLTVAGAAGDHHGSVTVQLPVKK